MFFFTSKRLHTIYIGDWSSDVCSSDLPSVEGREQDGDGVCEVRVRVRVLGRVVNHEREDEPLACGAEEVAGKRSEERRVGKECRSRWAPHLKEQEDTKCRHSEQCSSKT